MSSHWPYLAGGAVILLLLSIIFFRISKRKKPTAADLIISVEPDEKIRSIIERIPTSNGQSQTLLLAASRLSDLPVTVPVKLAIQLSTQGKCLLIDLDRKRDAMARVFDVDSSTIDTHLRVAPIQTSFENLSIWPARYFDLLKQMNLRSLLNAANKNYDHTLLYAPYLTVLADRKQIASCSKQAVVFGNPDKSDLHSQLHRLLKMCDCKVLCEV